MPPAIFAAPDQRGMIVLEMQQVLGEIQPLAGEPPGARHRVGVFEGDIIVVRGLEPAELPHGRPEMLGVIDAPAPQPLPVIDPRGQHAADAPHELRDLGALDALRGRLPEGGVVHDCSSLSNAKRLPRA
jgi:hypothetical protein